MVCNASKKTLAHLLKVCNSVTLDIWNFQLPTYLITPVAWHGSRSTFTRQVSTVQNVAHREHEPEFFVKLGGVNWWCIGAASVT